MRKKLSVSISALLISSLGLGLLLPLARGDNLYLSLDGLLPSKSDDPAVYPVLQETEWYYGTSWTETLSVPGFVEGRAVEYYRRNAGLGDIRSVEFYVYLFSDGNSAEVYCDSEIDNVMSIEGQTEISVVGAFGVVYEYRAEYVELKIGMSCGTISNVVFKVVVSANTWEDPTNRLVSFTSLERTRILDKGGNPSIPEFSSLMMVPFLVLATLVATKFGRKIHGWK